MERTTQRSSDPDFTFSSEPVTSTERPSRQPVALLALIMRALGAVTVIGSAAVYLFPRWQGGDDIERYLMLMAITLVLTGAGFFCSFKLKENKGARTLLGLTLGVTPIHFAVLGGLLFSKFSGGALPYLPDYATWRAPSASTAVMVTAGAVAVLVPAAWLSFMVLARNSSRQLSALFLLANAALLIPLRLANPVALLAITLGVLLLTADHYWFRMHSAMKTREGIYCRVLLLIPVAILIGRSLMHYPVSAWLAATLFALPALLLFVAAPRFTERPIWQDRMQKVALLPAAIAWSIIALELIDLFSLTPVMVAPLLCWPVAALLIAAARFGPVNGRFNRIAAALLVLGSGLLNLVLFTGAGVALILILSGIAVLISGFMLEQKILFASGTGATLVGLVYSLTDLSHLFSLAHWWVLALLGVVLIVAASWLEGQRGRLWQRLGQLRQQVGTWDY